MPDGNLAIVLAAFAAFQRGDEEAMLSAASPEIVVTQFPDQLDVHDFHGRDEAIVRWQIFHSEQEAREAMAP